MTRKAPDPSSFASRLKSAAADRGLSQADLARRLGVTRGAVSHWYSGRSVPEGATLAALADAVGVAARWIASGVGDRTPAPAPAAPSTTDLDEVESALLNAFRSLSPEGRSALASLAVAVANQSADAEILDFELAASTRGAVTSLRRAALDMVRAWLCLPESLRMAHKRRIETDALRHREPAMREPVAAPRVAPTQQSRR